MSFLSVVGTILGIASTATQYNASQDAARQMRIAGEENAKLSELETKERIRRSRYQYDQEQGQRVVSYAKAGVDIGSGSSMAVMAEAATVADREIAFTKEQGKRTAKARSCLLYTSPSPRD